LTHERGHASPQIVNRDELVLLAGPTWYTSDSYGTM